MSHDPVRYPHYHLVPKERADNIAFRNTILKKTTNPDLAMTIWRMCKDDPLFYLNTFGWTYDPRLKNPVIPFITWDFQDEMVGAFNDAIDVGYDLLAEKTRDMGFTWIVSAVMEHRWHFMEMQTFLMASMKEDKVDSSDNPDCIFWKIDFLHKMQPNWLHPAGPPRRKHLHIGNPYTGSTIDGDSSTGDLGRSGRRTAIFFDEFAFFPNDVAVKSSTADVTRCRIFVSTHLNAGTEFYRMSKNPEVKKVKAHWSLHPEKSKGSYTDADGKLRSPWYDEECKRRTKEEVARELDIDPFGSDYQFFPDTQIRELLRKTAPPLFEGHLEFDPVTLKPTQFVHRSHGPWKIWTVFDTNTQPLADRNYVIAADISFGTGASYSALSVGETREGKKIAEYICENISPEQFAELAIAACRFFSGIGGTTAFLGWEANGPGRSFGSRVLDKRYSRIYFRKTTGKVSQKTTEFPGWWSDNNTKFDLLRRYRTALIENAFSNPSEYALEETLLYVCRNNNVVEYAPSSKNPNPFVQGQSHGDIVIADALLFLLLKEIGLTSGEVRVHSTTSVAGRRAYLRAQQETKKDVWKASLPLTTSTGSHINRSLYGS